MKQYKRFQHTLVLAAAASLLTGCFAVRHSGYGIKMQPTGQWQQVEVNWSKYRDTHIFSLCNGNEVKPSNFRIEYLTWIGPPFLPIIPVTRPHRFYQSFDLFYQHFKDKRIENCPVISINKGEPLKARSFDGSSCYYYPEVLPNDFTMSFEGGLDGCKLDDLQFKVTPFHSIDWFWRFNG